MLLKNYIETLSQIEQGVHPLKKYKNSSMEKEDREAFERESSLINLLELENLIGSTGRIHNSDDSLYITPKGAIALFEWKNNIKEKSTLHKFKSQFIHLFWLIVGAALTYIVRVNT